MNKELAGKRWFILVFLVFWPTSITGEGGNGCEVPRNEEALGGMAEVSPKEQEVEDVVERYPKSNPQDVGLRTVPSGPGDPLKGLLILLKGNPSCQSQSQSPHF